MLSLESQQLLNDYGSITRYLRRFDAEYVSPMTNAVVKGVVCHEHILIDDNGNSREVIACQDLRLATTIAYITYDVIEALVASSHGVYPLRGAELNATALTVIGEHRIHTPQSIRSVPYSRRSNAIRQVFEQSRAAHVITWREHPSLIWPVPSGVRIA